MTAFPGLGWTTATVVFSMLTRALDSGNVQAAGPATGTGGPSPWRALQTVARTVPAPMPKHPGNVFLEGDVVRAGVPDRFRATARSWRATDDQGKPIATGTLAADSAAEAGVVDLGRRGIGWYRVEFLDAGGKTVGWTSAAVLHRVTASTPQDSPVCVDAASAWFAARYRPKEAHAQEVFASLAALAGVNWIRDRLSWGEVETAPGTFAARTRYDSSAALQTRHGLKTLQVFHSTPGWAADKTLDGDRAGRRFPRDLRVMYRFCRTLGQRFSGHVFAWEPWNEANIGGFGGHTINEMCSLQKAAYLGFKRSAPRVTVCWNVFAGAGNDLQTEVVLRNETWPYFDTYNIHSYNRPVDYLHQFATARRAACGRPIWISECGIRLRSRTDAPWGDMSVDEARRQAEFVARSYASSLYAGVNRHFFFILGNYIERGIQFGMLRHDFTPRPGYCALAAVGRFLAGARCLGQWTADNKSGAHIVAFRSRPDDRERDVLIAWSEKPGTWAAPKPVPVEAAYDYLGRSLPGDAPIQLGPAPVFVILPTGASTRLGLEPPPARAPARAGTPSPVVLQVQLPESAVRLNIQGYRVPVGKAFDVPVDVYNFSDAPVRGTLAVDARPTEWTLDLAPASVKVEPMGRVRLTARVNIGHGGRAGLFGAWVRLRGDFGKAGRPVLAFRLAADAAEVKPERSTPIISAGRSAAWEDNIVGGARMTHERTPAGEMLFEMHFGDTDPWGYPRLDLGKDEGPPATFDGLKLTVRLLEGSGVVRVQFIEENGASYITNLPVKSATRTPQQVVVLFENAHWGSWSAPDPNHQLDLGQVRTILVGINSQRNSTVRMAVSNLAWIKY